MLRRNWIKALAFGLIAAVSGVGAQAATITDLYNTGVDGSGNLLASGVSDTHYSATFNGGSPFTPVAGYLSPSWVPNIASPPRAGWIVPTLEGNQPNGEYAYTTSFTLAADALTTTVLISGQMTSDDQVYDILINGTSISPLGGVLPTADESYGSLHAFSISAASYNLFTTGSNTITFVTKNTHGVVSGLLVQMAGTYTTRGEVPEPTSVAMLGIGVVGLAAARRFRTRRAG